MKPETPPSGAVEARTFTVPVEMVIYQARATSMALLRRAHMQGATFRPTAPVWRAGRVLLARVDFAVPVRRAPGGPADWSEQLVQLSPHLWECVS